MDAKQLRDQLVADMKKALEPVQVKYDKLFNKLIDSKLEDLNNRYKRHLFIFTDRMGSQSLDMYHRVSGKRIMYWIGGCRSPFIGDEFTSVVNDYSDLRYTELAEDLQAWVDQLLDFESQQLEGVYLTYEGKVTLITLLIE